MKGRAPRRGGKIACRKEISLAQSAGIASVVAISVVSIQRRNRPPERGPEAKNEDNALAQFALLVDSRTIKLHGKDSGKLQTMLHCLSNDNEFCGNAAPGVLIPNETINGYYLRSVRVLIVCLKK